jgi:gamma-glutamyl-gamma-aminobutyrate hydrolase PuuD
MKLPVVGVATTSIPLNGGKYAAVPISHLDEIVHGIPVIMHDASPRRFGTSSARVPVIGVSAATVTLNGERYAIVSELYLEAIAHSGAESIILHDAMGIAGCLEVMHKLHALICTGGSDVGPAHYGQTTTHARDVDTKRDLFELAIVRDAYTRGLPVFGVCRGLQVMVISTGGDLYQDISSEVPCALNHMHSNTAEKDKLIHEVNLTLAARTTKALGEASFNVNSLHHQGVRTLRGGFRPFVYATDGIIEGIEHSEGKPFRAVQWHPEALAKHGSPHQKLFDLVAKDANTFLRESSFYR